jgi:hypothetical protein
MEYRSKLHNDFLALVSAIHSRLNGRFETEFEHKPEGAWGRMETAANAIGLAAQIEGFQQLCSNAITGIKELEEKYRITGKALAVRIQELADGGHLELNGSGKSVLKAFIKG